MAENDKNDEYQKKLDEARKELAGNFTTPGARDATESARRAIQKDEILAGLSEEELKEKRRLAQEALGGKPQEKKKIYTPLERQALKRAKEVSKILETKDKESEKARTAPPPSNLPGARIAPPKITPEQEHFKKPAGKPSYATRFVSSVKDADIDALLGKKPKEPPQAPKKESPDSSVKQVPPKEKKKEEPTEHEKLQQEIIKEKKSLAQIAIEQQKRREALEQGGYYKKVQSRQTIVIVVAIVLVMLSTSLIVYNVFLTKPDVVIPTQPQAQEYLISPNTVESISLSPPETFADRFFSKVTEVPLPEGSVQALRVTQTQGENVTQAPLDEVLVALSVTPPTQLTTSFGDEYMVGTYGDISNYAFFVTTIDSFTTSFDALLNWETSGMNRLYTTLTGSTRDPQTRGAVWRDVYIRNIDARALQDRAGDTYLIYSFPDKNTLVVAPSVASFLEIIERLRTPEQILR